MRDCALWVTSFVDRNTEVILDTSALTDEEWRTYERHDLPPKDTILVLIHPVREVQVLKIAADTFTGYMSLSDPNHRHIAACLIDIHCKNDPELRRKLRWD